MVGKYKAKPQFQKKFENFDKNATEDDFKNIFCEKHDDHSFPYLKTWLLGVATYNILKERLNCNSGPYSEFIKNRDSVNFINTLSPIDGLKFLSYILKNF